MTAAVETLGLIAGSRTLPLLFARQAKSMGVGRVVAVAFQGETDPGITSVVDEVVWLKVGQLNKMIGVLKRWKVRQCVLAGQIAPKNLFEVRPDLRALGLLLKLKEKNAHTIFGALVRELGGEGIEVIEATPWLEPLMPGPGFALGPKLSAELERDVQFGYRTAKEIARMEIGQSVVVKDGVVLAVEAFEGTDSCLARGGDLAGSEGGAVAVKVAKEKHDMRFDIPCIGAGTLEICARHRVRVLAVEARKTLLLEAEQVKESAQRNRVSVVTAG